MLAQVFKYCRDAYKSIHEEIKFLYGGFIYGVDFRNPEERKDWMHFVFGGIRFGMGKGIDNIKKIWLGKYAIYMEIGTDDFARKTDCKYKRFMMIYMLLAYKGLELNYFDAHYDNLPNFMESPIPDEDIEFRHVAYKGSRDSIFGIGLADGIFLEEFPSIHEFIAKFGGYNPFERNDGSWSFSATKVVKIKNRKHLLHITNSKYDDNTIIIKSYNAKIPLSKKFKNQVFLAVDGMVNQVIIESNSARFKETIMPYVVLD